jgi:tetratricopeptide (TPR) repeat protein
VLATSNLEALAEIYLNLGRTAEAVSSYQESIELLRSMRATYDLAHTLGLLAKALADQGDRGPARGACAGGGGHPQRQRQRSGQAGTRGADNNLDVTRFVPTSVG